MEQHTLFKLSDLIRLGSKEEAQLAKAEVFRRMPHLPDACVAARVVYRAGGIPEGRGFTLPEFPALEFFCNGPMILAFHHAWAHNPVWDIPSTPIRF